VAAPAPGILADAFAADARARASRPEIAPDRRVRPWATAQAEAEATGRLEAEREQDEQILRRAASAAARRAEREMDAASAAGRPPASEAPPASGRGSGGGADDDDGFSADGGALDLMTP